MRKVVCTIGSGPHRALLDVTAPALERYADRHGYDAVVLDRKVAPHRPASWSKVALLHDLVHDYDLVCWIDSDALVVDGAPDVADACVPRAFLHLVEHALPIGRVPNCGVMVLRGGATSRRLLLRLWRRVEFVQHHWWENAALLRLLGYRTTPPVHPVRPSAWRLGVHFLDRAWNSIPADPSPRPYVVHVPGLSLEDRLARLRAVASMA